MGRNSQAVLTATLIEAKFLREFGPRMSAIDPNTHLSVSIKGANHFPSVFVYIRRKEKDAIGSVLAHFNMDSMPGCCGILVSHDTEVAEHCRRKGFGHLMQDMKAWIANKLKIAKIMATTTASNEAENSLLLKCEWKKLSSFTNPRTGNDLIAWERDINVQD